MENVILVTVDEPSEAYQAFSDLRRLSKAGAAHLRGGALIARDQDGRWSILEESDDGSYTGTLTGGAIGALTGALLGPVGLLLGGMTGAVVGSTWDLGEAEAIDVALATFPRQIPPGATALVADVEEAAPEVIDDVLGKFGPVQRLSRAHVDAELAAVSAVAEEEEDAAERAERDRRRSEGNETMADKFAALKDRLTGKA